MKEKKPSAYTQSKKGALLIAGIKPSVGGFIKLKTTYRFSGSDYLTVKDTVYGTCNIPYENLTIYLKVSWWLVIDIANNQLLIYLHGMLQN